MAELKSLTLKEYNNQQFVRVYDQAPMYMQNLSKGYWFKYLPESKAMYMSFSTLFKQDGNISIKKTIGEILNQLDGQKTEKLIIDFRLCRGGNYNNVLPLIQEIRNRPSLNVKGKLFVINGRLTFSAAAVATLHLKDQTEAIVVGEVSRSRPNWAENMEGYSLPNSKLDFDCTEELKIHSAGLGKSDRIPVDVPINRSFEHYKAGRDEVMEYIVSLKE